LIEINVKIIIIKESNYKVKMRDLFIRAETSFFKSISKEYHNFSGAAEVFVTGVESANLNFVILRRNIIPLEEVVQRGKNIFVQFNLPWTLIVPDYLLNKKLDNFQQASVAMYLDLNRIKENSDNKNIKLVNDNLQDWAIPLIEGFESTEVTTHQYQMTHENVVNLYHFVLYEQEQPITSLTLSINQELARIDDVATLPSFQGKGYATSIIKYALLYAKNLGAHYCFLEASSSGLKLYQNLGFSPIYENKIYTTESETSSWSLR